MQRIAVMGTTCSGKSTLARALAEGLGLPYVELDSLYWGPRWSQPAPEAFRRRVEAFVRDEAWVVDGNYTSKLGHLVIARADTLVWLDPPLPRVLWRVWRRTIDRIMNRAELWSGNRETWRTAFLTRDSLFVWAPRTHRRFRRRLPERLAQDDLTHVRLIRLGSFREAQRWLEQATG